MGGAPPTGPALNIDYFKSFLDVQAVSIPDIIEIGSVVKKLNIRRAPPPGALLNKGYFKYVSDV